MLLENKVVFITGAAGGIGRERALACAREGASVVVADIDFERAQATAAEIGDTALAADCDVADGSSVMRAVGVAVGRFWTNQRSAQQCGNLHPLQTPR
jgi:NAD(P)-dependent dehydrogenase (short-subunit alcohol dehydrogenase family)